VSGPSTRASVGATRRRVPLWVVLIAMLAAGLCALLALNTASAALEVQTRGLSDSNANTSDEQQQLTRDLAVKQAPGNLAAAAAALGLVPNQNPAFLRINQNGSVTVLGNPVPATPAPTPTPSPTPSAKPKPSATPSPSASASKTPKPGASSAKSTPKPGTTVTVTVTASAKPSATATKPTAKPPSARATAAATSSSAAGGH
jgi:outer membrane biosynthesis protein TonB